jgi:uncharacterized membrane-anchored protein YjiN (DUF445 family)
MILKTNFFFKINETDIYEEVENWTSKYRRFNTSQHITKFILKSAAALSEERLKEIFDTMMDQAVHNQPFTDNHSSLVIGVLINGEGLDSPLVLPSNF